MSDRMLFAWGFLALVFVAGMLVGGFVTMLVLYWQLATGRRTVRPLHKAGADGD